ncbi:hypothetical protein BH09BAC6_BH09BAC6_31010 [soil metagenome]|jgi:hypothetical protein
MDSGKVFKLSVNDPAKAMSFLTANLGFTTLRDNTDDFGNRECLLKDKEGNNYMLAKIIYRNIYNNNDVINIISTSDCLKDYFYLNSSGVKFEGQPEYADDALIVRIVDNWGNKYVLMERRNCDDN